MFRLAEDESDEDEEDDEEDVLPDEVEVAGEDEEGGKG